MTKTITQQLEEVFQTASLNHARNKLTSLRDLEEYSDITRRADETREELTKQYDEEYDARVDAERQRLYDKAAQVSFDHPAPPGAPTANSDTITIEAHRRVRLAHDADLQAVVNDAVRETEALLERAERRNQVEGMSKEAFGDASERRSGFERRTLKQSQD